MIDTEQAPWLMTLALALVANPEVAVEENQVQSWGGGGRDRIF
jgi:hypothetical protein